MERGSITKPLDISTSTFVDFFYTDLSLSSFIMTDKGGMSAREEEFNRVQRDTETERDCLEAGIREGGKECRRLNENKQSDERMQKKLNSVSLYFTSCF